MEEKLQALINNSRPEAQIKLALEQKRQGKKVIGVISTYVPEEVLSAAGLFPWRIFATQTTDITLAGAYRPRDSNEYCTRVLESVLCGDLDFLDGIVLSDIDHEFLRLWDVITHLKKFPLCYIMHAPFHDEEVAVRFLENEIRKLIAVIQNFTGATITEEALFASIDAYNGMRTLLGKVYELRKKERPSLSGTEAMCLMMTAHLMPRAEFVQELKALLPFLGDREAKLSAARPRLLVVADYLYDPRYFELIEKYGCIAMDDLDVGSRYIKGLVDTTLEEPLYSLAKRYLSHHGGPTSISWERQIQQLGRWVREYRIDGILSLPLQWDYHPMYRMPILIKALEEAKIRHMSFEREFYLTHIEQFRTRIETFAEILQTEAK
jgi:benzoyl-CoA reductase/2-hydroxyglutaryl-CoA dehydratase subunit BcrC/BadD/HgdB